MGRLCTYTYDVGGVSYTTSGSTRFPATGGAVRVLGDPAAPERLYSLTAVQGGQLVGNQLVSGSRKYTLSDDVVVFDSRGGGYYLSTLSRAEESGAQLTAWYDKAESEGGRIRVIVVK